MLLGKDDRRHGVWECTFCDWASHNGEQVINTGVDNSHRQQQTSSLHIKFGWGTTKKATVVSWLCDDAVQGRGIENQSCAVSSARNAEFGKKEC
jgi:hypothetical protein